MTDRSAWLLARRHGLGNIAAFADSLPDDAHVIDVGAGRSDFGARVAARQPNISWGNVDINYTEDRTPDWALDAPPNLDFIKADVTRLTDTIKPLSIDYALSYWLFPHLSAGNLYPAKLAAMAMFAVTKPDGIISIGPTFRQGIRSFWPWMPRTVRVQKSEYADGASFADYVVQATRMS